MKHMALKLILTGFIFAINCNATATNAQVRIYPQDVEELIFPPMRIDLNSLYFSRIMLRYSEPWMQIVMTERPKGIVEVDFYTVMPDSQIDEMFRRANQEGDARITAEQIAKKIVLTKRNTSIKVEQYNQWLSELQNIKATIRLGNDLLCFDGCPSFRLWFDTRQDSIQYSFLYAPSDPPFQSTQRLIAEWMLKVRLEVSTLDAKTVNKK
jgi:hypothetical protein